MVPGGAEFMLRPGSSDRKSVDETWAKNAYRRPSFGFDVEPGETWLDLGANIGAFSVYAHLRGASVVPFEPEPVCSALCRDNLALNGWRGTVRREAVVPDSEETKSLALHVNHNPKGFRRHTLFEDYLGAKRKKHYKPIAVPTAQFSSLVSVQGTCLKVNIEGAEVPIFETVGFDTLRLVRKLVFEYSFDYDKSIPRLRSLLARLGSSGFDIKTSRAVPANADIWEWYPPNVYVFCIRRG